MERELLQTLLLIRIAGKIMYAGAHSRSETSRLTCYVSAFCVSFPAKGCCCRLKGCPFACPVRSSVPSWLHIQAGQDRTAVIDSLEAGSHGTVLSRATAKVACSYRAAFANFLLCWSVT